jgi:hypothetical protein
MSSKRARILTVIGLAALLAVLFAWPKLNNPYRAQIAAWNAGGVACLSDGHANLAQHFHPHIDILVDGVKEYIPQNTGIVTGCMAEIHTHDSSGTIHIETVNAFKIVHLRDFAVVYGQPLAREGYDLKMTVDGKPNIEFGELVLKDQQLIVLNYTKK